MEDRVLNRELVAEFFKDSRGKVRLINLIVLQETVSNHSGKVYVSRDQYDVDYSRHYGYLFHMSGSGGGPPVEVSGIYFVKGTPEVEEKEPQWVHPKDSPPWTGKRTLAIRKRNQTRRIPQLPKAFDVAEGEDLLDWLHTNGIEGESVWCSTCRDCFPGSDDWNLCKHCWWCDNSGTYSTPSERCKCKNREECQED